MLTPELCTVTFKDRAVEDVVLLEAKAGLQASSIETLCIAPGSPWENGYVESLNIMLSDDLLNRDFFCILTN